MTPRWVMRVKGWFHEPTTGATVVIAVATVVNLLVSIGLWLVTLSSLRVSREVFDTANRPYVGVDTFDVHHDYETKSLQLTMIIKNFGTAPAGAFNSTWQIWMDGHSIVPVPIDKPYTLFPGQTSVKLSAVTGDRFDQVMRGSVILDITTWVSYDGPSHVYHYCEKHQYRPDRRAVMKLGTC